MITLNANRSLKCNEVGAASEDSHNVQRTKGETEDWRYISVSLMELVTIRIFIYLLIYLQFV
jgi:hypothetical protein